ncbi:chemotaxis protein CheA [Lacimonas salitolerans]|uniref:Chemotaxis protein CheA n=1 Tax=Lacimonas salitolerans TaxID=1323750 RepID=A0ABW4EDY2_9RHOB
MVNTSKILTVSYGTFSCTLEGFDDSFETMKAIAEYFRDLAADDRYFGAEPPVPDAEMLARIAEREIARRVEAREEKGGIVLRAAQPEETYSLTAPMPAAKAKPADQAQPEPVAKTEPAATPEPTATSEPQPTPAEDLQDSRQAPADAIADAHAQETPSAAESQDVAAARPDAPTMDQPEQALSEDVVSDEVATEDVVTEDVIAEDVAAEDMPVRRAVGEDSTIAAKLQRIRAVVSRNTAVPAEYSEDEHADIFAEPETVTPDAVLTEEAKADAAAEMAVEDVTGDDVAGDDDLTLADILAEVRIDPPKDTDTAEASVTEDAQDDAGDGIPQEDIAEVDVTGAEAAEYEDEYEDNTFALDPQESAPQPPETLTAQDSPEPETEDENAASQPEQTVLITPAPATQDASQDLEDDDDDVAAILDRLAGLSPDTAEDTPAATTVEEERDELDDILAGLADQPDERPDQANHAAPETTQDPTQPSLRARVVKMKRTDFEAAIAQGHLEETDEEDDWHALDDSALSPEEEADLQAELAEVEAELHREDDTLPEDDSEEVDSIFAEAQDDTPYPADRRRALDQLDEAASERDMTRLMAKTISEMDEPESASRRNAIAHLRAAVAATRADKEAGVTERPDTISDAFRDDLASVVRPRRPRAEGTQTARPVEQSRAAPLKLVAEQRIDAPVAPPAPVRPRRVSMAEIQQEPRQAAATTEPGSSFAEYVEEKGAHDLPEILEAAASFLSFVEGRDQFTRPQLMTRARSVVGEDFSREDGLRSFGQLLRQGKIQKLKGGRFTVSDQIGFQPSARRAG